MRGKVLEEYLTNRLVYTNSRSSVRGGCRGGRGGGGGGAIAGGGGGAKGGQSTSLHIHVSQWSIQKVNAYASLGFFNERIKIQEYRFRSGSNSASHHMEAMVRSNEVCTKTHEYGSTLGMSLTCLCLFLVASRHNVLRLGLHPTSSQDKYSIYRSVSVHVICSMVWQEIYCCGMF